MIKSWVSKINFPNHFYDFQKLPSNITVNSIVNSMILV